MKHRVRPYGQRLAATLTDDTLGRLAADPIAAVAVHVPVHAVTINPATDECTCDGAYLQDQGVICYVPTPNSRRENFTVLHEFGHHLVRADHDLLSELADTDDDGGVAAEERICDAFAGSVLIPDAAVDAVLAGRRPRATDVRRLYDGTAGSMEACAVRLAERIGCDGYVALLEPGTRRVRFASASPQSQYSWGRGSLLPHDHTAWKAVGGTHQGQGDVVWSSGNRRRMWVDAAATGPIVVAVFSDDLYWTTTSPGLSLLDEPGVTRAAPVAYGGACRHCGGPAFGTRVCAKCGDATCKRCGRCGCGAPPPTTRTCTQCHMTKGKAQFRGSSSVCRQCLDG